MGNQRWRDSVCQRKTSASILSVQNLNYLIKHEALLETLKPGWKEHYDTETYLAKPASLPIRQMILP